MRFYLDHDVDARVRTVLVARGHECWTAAEAGNATASDDDQIVYARSRGAALVSHDRGLADRRRHAIIGQHVALRCEQPDGPAIVQRWIDDLEGCLSRHPDVFISVGLGECNIETGWNV